MNKYISFGKINKKYIYIALVYSGLSSASSALQYSFVYTGKNSKYEDNIIFKIFLIYFGQTLLFIPEKILNKYIFKKEKEIPKIKNHNNPLIIEYIFNDLSDKLSCIDSIYILGISLLTLLIDLVNFILLKKFQQKAEKIIYNEDFYLFEFLFLFLISFYLYKIKYYKHQIYSITMIIILGLIRLLCKGKYYIELVFGVLNFIFLILFQIVISFFLSFIVVYTKGLMEYKYFTPYKACYVYAIINIIIVLIVYIIISFIPCNKSFCTVSFKGNNYIDHILSIFNNSGVAVFCLFLCSIITGCLKLLNNVIINNFTVCHLFLLFQTEEIINGVLHQISNEVEGLSLGFIVICHIFEIIFTFIFLEIIEIKYHNLNKNTKNNIQKRADNETNLIKKEYNGNVDDDDSLSDE